MTKRLMSLAAVVLLAAGAAAADDLTETFDRTYPIDPGGRVGLENINGDATIEVWDRPEVRVAAVKRASSADRLASLVIEVESTGSSVFIDTRYPSSRDLAPADRHGHSEVEYTLTVPRTAVLDDINLVNGDLLVEGVEGGIDADLVNGDLTVRGAGGEIELETVNGSIEIDLGVGAVEDVDLSSVNGEIDVVLGSGAEIRAETVNGRIRNDVGLEVRKGKYVGASMSGAVGGGGPAVEIETVNGGIWVGVR
ncbi:MAG: hypothetical protein MUC56_16670 [Thermoanaerobaculales bacterium]|jgi:DUF4097 and DUF4098 domain-containing protein YvlB|nr:hypothetical protein [Thermoanaerobaculales bacterium]